MDKKHPKISMRRQSELLGVSRSTADYKPVAEDPEEIRIKRLLDEFYLIDPCLGSRRLVTVLEREHGIKINRKRLDRLRREMGHEAIWCKPRTSIPDDGHRKYPHLLRNLTIDRPDQVWCADITYVPMPRGHAAIRCLKHVIMHDVDVENQKPIIFDHSQALRRIEHDVFIPVRSIDVNKVEEFIRIGGHAFPAEALLDNDFGWRVSAKAFTVICSMGEALEDFRSCATPKRLRQMDLEHVKGDESFRLEDINQGFVELAQRHTNLGYCTTWRTECFDK
jgi:putative transposase